MQVSCVQVKMCKGGVRTMQTWCRRMIPYFEDKFPHRKLGKPDEVPQV